LQAGLEVEERDFFQDPFTEAELRALIGDRSPADIFSWKSPSFRKMGIDRDSLDDDRMIALMLEEPRLIRRPVTAIGDTLIVGAGSKALSQALSS
jgi:arsenate reductase-like glutaredoxin family protein